MQNFQTSDYQATVVLCALGYKLEGLDRSNPKRVSFLFEDDPTIVGAIAAYFADELTLNPRIVLHSAKLVKDRLYSGT